MTFLKSNGQSYYLCEVFVDDNDIEQSTMISMPVSSSEEFDWSQEIDLNLPNHILSMETARGYLGIYLHERDRQISYEYVSAAWYYINDADPLPDKFALVFFYGGVDFGCECEKNN